MTTIRTGRQLSQRRTMSALPTAPTTTKLRWGIIGTANIAKKNARAIALSPLAELVAVASRDLQRCQSWAAEFACARAVECDVRQVAPVASAGPPAVILGANSLEKPLDTAIRTK